MVGVINTLSVNDNHNHLLPCRSCLKSNFCQFMEIFLRHNPSAITDAAGVLDALKPRAGKETPKDSTKSRPAEKTSARTPSSNSQLQRGRTNVRNDPKNDRSKSQPSREKASNSTAKRSSTLGRK